MGRYDLKRIILFIILLPLWIVLMLFFSLPFLIENDEIDKDEMFEV